MADFLFDPNTRDVVIKDGDFVLVDDPSEQNGGILRDAHCFSIYNPNYGIGLERVINSGVEKVNYEMNRWQSQIAADKGWGNFKITEVNKVVSVAIQVHYV